MKLAAIDIGTNSTRLLVCDACFLSASKTIGISPIVREMQITRLGKNLESSRRINAGQASHTINVLKNYKRLMDENHVEKYRAVGTRALRLAENSGQFLSEARRKTGIDIEIISGSQEAELSFSGAVKSLDLNRILKKSDLKSNNKTILVLDIGGGSTEFILGNTMGDVVFSSSVGDGSVSVSEKFLKQDKPEEKELETLKTYVKKRFARVIKKVSEYSFLCIIGLAGTITTLAAVDSKLAEYNRDKIHRYVLGLKRIRGILLDLCSSGLKQRKQITGLDPLRADIIIGGTMILIEILGMLNKDKITVSESDILDGIIYSILQF